MNGNLTGGLAIVLALIIGGGTFVVYDRLNELKTEVEILKLANKPADNQEIKTATSTEEASQPTVENIPESADKITTALLFQAPSDPSLQPITSLNLTVPEISRNKDGVLALQIKVFTDKAAGYTALKPADIFSIVNLTGDDIKAYETKGQFSSMPAKSSTSGHLLFQTDPNKSSLILKINMGEEMKFYELDFKNKTYKETIIG